MIDAHLPLADVLLPHMAQPALLIGRKRRRRRRAAQRGSDGGGGGGGGGPGDHAPPAAGRGGLPLAREEAVVALARVGPTRAIYRGPYDYRGGDPEG